METVILLQEQNPHGTMFAVLECDDRTCCLYLYDGKQSVEGLRTVWVRNLQPAPTSLDTKLMEEGEAPLNPTAFCRHPDGAPAPDSDDLCVVWLPEGNGVALYERNELLAIIPPWSGGGGFHGYARDAIGEGPLAWELTENNVQIARFDSAMEFWDSWDDENTWPNLSDKIIATLEKRYGKHTGYYAIDGGGFPPRALLKMPSAKYTVMATVGLSILPMPNVEMSVENPETLNRVEIAAALPAAWSEEALTRFARYISSTASIPWQNNTWIGVGHTIPCDAWTNREFTFAMLVSSLKDVPISVFQHAYSSSIPLLWLLPITTNEQRFAVEHGSASLLATLPDSRWQAA